MQLSFRPLLPLVFSVAALAAVPQSEPRTLERAASKPVAFVFQAPSDTGNPFARELWGDVKEPSGKILRLPAYYAGDGRFCVHARPDERGTYRFVGVTEGADAGAARSLSGKLVSSPDVTVESPETLPQVEIDPKDPSSFALSNGAAFWPMGMNLAWAPRGGTRYYDEALSSFAAAGLNWMRVWMAHWDGMNLEWLPPTLGASPVIGTLDQTVAARWDDVVAHAQSDGVYLQWVLQHHGQYSSTVNTNWPENPFNAANPGGFLKTPTDFFTNSEALRLTREKYRYIVARWGWSSAIMAWELFNEVHWTDAFQNPQTRPTVGAWHTAMAKFIRSVDVYHHLVTTSTQDLDSPIYAALDYYQPHSYPANIFAELRTLPSRPERKPVFYGETGDDHIPVSDAVKETGVLLGPPVWASLMGEGRYPAQEWRGEQAIETGRVGELGAVARFLRATRMPARTDLTPDLAVVECPQRVPFLLAGGQYWQRHDETVIDLPLDGRMPASLAEIPTVLADHGHAAKTGFPGKVGFRVVYPQAATLTVHVDGVGKMGAALRILVDGKTEATRRWPAAASGVSPSGRIDETVSAALSPGHHLVELVNDGGEDWFSISSIDMGVSVPVLAAVGKRGPGFLTYWLWNRDGVFSPSPVPAVAGTLVVDAVPPGRWRVVWWDTFKGEPTAPVVVDHAGGALRLPTPPISRHAAVVITRIGS